MYSNRVTGISTLRPRFNHNDRELRVAFPDLHRLNVEVEWRLKIICAANWVREGQGLFPRPDEKCSHSRE